MWAKNEEPLRLVAHYEASGVNLERAASLVDDPHD